MLFFPSPKVFYRVFLRLKAHILGLNGFKFLYKKLSIKFECSFDSRFLRHIRDVSDEDILEIYDSLSIFCNHKRFKKALFIVFQRDMIKECFYFNAGKLEIFKNTEHVYFLLEQKRKHHKSVLNDIFYISTQKVHV